MSTEPMDWGQYMLARQLLAEERIGRRIREAEAAEEAEFRASRDAILKG